MPQLYISNSIDTGRNIAPGLFQAATAQNPALRSWGADRISGAPNGCAYRLTFNNQRAPFDNVLVRRAINAALDRSQIILLAYEGTSVPLVAPFALFGALEAYTSQMQDLFDTYALDAQGQAETDALMTEAGFSRNNAGLWADSSGAALELNIQMLQGDPAGPVIAQQLRNAGFDTTFNALENAAFVDIARSGEFGLHLWVHCGSAYDPWQTLEHYHSKYAVPAGQSLTNIRSYTRYANPELDAILNAMEARVPSADDPEYMELVRQATEIYLRDLPDITFGAEFQTLVMNETYWTGWPSADNPYMHALPPWDGFALVVHNLKPAR
jgi:peptide/nickel transport system substrate-binding protein